MEKIYYLLCVGKNWNKVNCESIRIDYVDGKDTDDYDAIQLREVRKGIVTKRGRTFLKGYYYYDEPGLVDVPIFVEKIGYYLQDVLTGTRFPIYSENEKILFHYCYPTDESTVVNFLKSLSEEDKKRYRLAMLDLWKSTRNANIEIKNEETANSDYIKQLKKKYK